MQAQPSPRWWGGRWHIIFTVTVFVVLASLDNAAIGLIPPLYAVIARDLAVSEALLGMVTATSILAAAVTAVGWGYWGDRTSRKRLLLWGTLLWAAAIGGSGLVTGLVQLLVLQLLAAVGLGCIASVGFSVISDFVAPQRRGLVLSLWGLSQGIGSLGGSVLAGLLGAANWRLPFFVLAGAGLLFSLLYLLTFDPQRGRREPELAQLFASGGDYDYRMEPGDIRGIFARKTNVWLILQGFTAQFGYGSLIWMPRLMVAKVQAEGYSIETATMVGSLFGALFTVGGLFSILAGHLGDVWQRRNPAGRAWISSIGILGAIPLFVALIFIPLQGLAVPEGAGTGAVIGAVLTSVFTNPWVAAAFLLALGAQALTSADSPNWFALISDVNPPENRGTVFGLGNLSNGIGRSLGNGLTGVSFAYFASALAAPWNYAVGLALFQLFFIPTGLCYYMATRSSPEDIARTRALLSERARQAS